MLPLRLRLMCMHIRRFTLATAPHHWRCRRADVGAWRADTRFSRTDGISTGCHHPAPWRGVGTDWLVGRIWLLSTSCIVHKTLATELAYSTHKDCSWVNGRLARVYDYTVGKSYHEISSKRLHGVTYRFKNTFTELSSLRVNRIFSSLFLFGIITGINLIL